MFGDDLEFEGEDTLDQLRRFEPSAREHAKALETEAALSKINPLDIQGVKAEAVQGGKCVGCKECAGESVRAECVSHFFKVLKVPHLQVKPDESEPGMLVVLFPSRQNSELGPNGEHLIAPEGIASDKMVVASISAILSVAIGDTSGINIRSADSERE